MQIHRSFQPRFHQKIATPSPHLKNHTCWRKTRIWNQRLKLHRIYMPVEWLLQVPQSSPFKATHFLHTVLYLRVPYDQPQV